MAIPVTVIWGFRRRLRIHDDMPRAAYLFVALFGAFVIACGLGHLIEVFAFKGMPYRLAGFWKVVTASVSLATALVLPKLVPVFVNAVSPAQFTLQTEVLKRLFEDAAIGHAIVEPDGKFRAVNRTFEQILERRFEEITSMDFQAITPEPWLSQDMAEVKKCLAGTQNSYKMVKPYAMPDGRLKWAQLCVSSIRDPQTREFQFFYVQVTDIDAQVRKTELLQELGNRTRAHVEQLEKQLAAVRADVKSEGLQGLLDQIGDSIERLEASNG